jgi:hypothetical protein
MLFAGKGMELENFMLCKITKLRKTNMACSHSYAKSRFKMIKITIIMGLECKTDTVGGIQGERQVKWRGDGGRIGSKYITRMCGDCTK